MHHFYVLPELVKSWYEVFFIILWYQHMINISGCAIRVRFKLAGFYKRNQPNYLIVSHNWTLARTCLTWIHNPVPKMGQCDVNGLACWFYSFVVLILNGC
jgi:hypothetical protein